MEAQDRRSARPVCGAAVEWHKMRRIKIIVERHPDAYAYPLGMKGVVVGQGDTYEAALADVKSAIKAHLEAFGAEVLEGAR